MNNLSWMLYYAELFGSLGIFFAIIGCIGSLFSVATLIYAYCARNDHLKRYGEKDSDYQTANSVFRLFRWLTPAFFFLWTVGLAIPTKQTIYMIIASEMGEEASKTETGKKAIDALNRYLDNIGKEDNEE